MNIFNNLGLTQGATIQLDLATPADGSARQKVAVRPRSSSSSSSGGSATGGGINNGVEPELLPLYSNGDPIAGEIRVTPPPGKRLEHAGIKVRLIGRVELPSDRGGKHEFVSLVRDLSPPGELGAPASYRFDFGRVELPYESYSGGGAARLTYAVRASVKRPYGGSTAKEWGLAVRNAREQPPVTEAASSGAEINPTSTSSTSSLSPPTSSLPSPPIKMEVGIEDCLHIEFEYDKACYHLSDVVLGRISFLLVRIRLKHMELEVRRRETSGAGSNARSEATTLCKYEIMDGAPVRGETVPIRLCLAPYDLTPTYLNVHNKFSARYFLNLVLVDEEDRRYFKQQEITLWRKKGADERACGGGKGVGCCSGAAAAAAAAPAPPSVSPSAAAAAAVPPATPSAAAGTAPAAPAPQQPTEQLQMEEEAKEAAAPVEEEKREAAGGGGGGGEEEVKESEAAATTTDQEGEEREQERQQPATPPAA